jgi:transcriptional regulator with XRE-family HTH domain
MNYGKAVRISRSLADLSQRDLAAILETDASYISLIEANKREPSREFLERLADKLRIPMHLFVLLATEVEERGDENKHRLSELAQALVKLLFSTDEDGSGHRRNRAAQSRKPSKVGAAVVREPGRSKQLSGKRRQVL